MKKFVCIVLIGTLVMLLFACAAQDADVLGEWQSSITPEITVVFREDGTVSDYWEGELMETYTYEASQNEITVDQNGELYTLELKENKLYFMEEELYEKIS